MSTRRSTRLIQKENSKPTTAFKAAKQNTSNDEPKSKTQRNGSASPLPTKGTKSSYFDPDFSESESEPESSDNGSDSPPVKKKARVTSRAKKKPQRYASDDESSSDEFVQKPKSITEILQSKSELKLSSEESDSCEEATPKRKKKLDGLPSKKTASKIKSDSDSSDEFVKPNKPTNSTNDIAKTEPLDEPDVEEEKQSSQAEYFDFTALVKKVEANENIVPEEDKVPAEPKKTQNATPKKSKKVASSKSAEVKSENKADLEVFELLAMGEDTDMSATDIKESVSQSSQDNYEIPKQVEVLLDAPALKKKKPTDLEMTLRRRLNSIRRENQVYVHKVDILCWIAHGVYVNSVLNSPDLLSLALSLLPSDKCYPAKRMDMEYLGKLIEWFVKKIKLNKEPSDDIKINLSASLQSQLQKLEAQSKNDLCFMFICIIRALGIKCRLIVNLNVVPIKPTSDQLLPITSTSKKDTAAPTSTKKISEKETSSKSTKSKAHSSKSASKETKSEKSKPKESPKKEQQSSRTATKRPASKSDKPVEKATPTKESSSHSKPENSKNKSSSRDASKEKTKNTPEKSSPQVTKRSSRSQSAKPKDDVDESSTPQVDKEPARRSTRSKSSNSKDQSKYFEKEKPIRKSARVTSSSYFGKESAESKSSSKDESSKSSKPRDGKKSTSDKKKSTKKEPENVVEEMSTSDDSENEDSDTTFAPTKTKPKPKKKIDRRVLSSEEDVTVVEGKAEAKNKQNKLNYWLEVFLEAEEQWTCVDIAKKSYHCIQQLYGQTAHPVRYILAFNSDQTIKDVTRRYVPQYLSVTRKLRVDDTWWKATMNPYKPPDDPQNREEDEALEKVLEEQPLPTAISEYKNHPLYALKRHLLKFQGIYPPDAPTLGFVKGEPVYSRLCVVQLHGREMWIKEARVVKMGEKPYKIVKGRPNKNKFGTDEGPKDLELFGVWQTEEYDPPTAENGIVPRNSFGNVELFKPCMLPKGTVYLQIPGLMRIANKLNIDCAAAITGFEYSTNGWSYPVKDGFVVCEEFKEVLLDAYNQEMEEAIKKEKQKREERVYANWKRLIKAMFIREKLKRKYNFGDPGTSSETDKTEDETESK